MNADIWLLQPGFNYPWILGVDGPAACAACHNQTCFNSAGDQCYNRSSTRFNTEEMQLEYASTWNYPLYLSHDGIQNVTMTNVPAPGKNYTKFINSALFWAYIVTCTFLLNRYTTSTQRFRLRTRSAAGMCRHLALQAAMHSTRASKETPALDFLAGQSACFRMWTVIYSCRPATHDHQENSATRVRKKVGDVCCVPASPASLIAVMTLRS